MAGYEMRPFFLSFPAVGKIMKINNGSQTQGAPLTAGDPIKIPLSRWRSAPWLNSQYQAQL
jgi:hypothetical protein